MDTLQRANETFWAPGNRLVRTGDLVPGDDPVLQGRGHLFSPVVAGPTTDSALLERLARLEELLMAVGAAAAANTVAKPPEKTKPGKSG